MDFPTVRGSAELSPEAQQSLEIARAGISELRAAKHAAGLSYTVQHSDGHVRHAHPDGTIRVSRDAGSEIVG